MSEAHLIHLDELEQATEAAINEIQTEGGAQEWLENRSIDPSDFREWTMNYAETGASKVAGGEADPIGALAATGMAMFQAGYVLAKREQS